MSNSPKGSFRNYCAQHKLSGNTRYEIAAGRTENSRFVEANKSTDKRQTIWTAAIDRRPGLFALNLAKWVQEKGPDPSPPSEI